MNPLNLLPVRRHLPIALLLVVAGCANTDVTSMKDAEAPIEIARDEVSLWERGEEIERRIAWSDSVYDDPGLTTYLQDVVDRLIADVPNIPEPGPRVIIFDTSVRNAFALPHGALYFSTGLLESLESEAEFAIIAGHELTHYLNRHSLSETRNAANQEKWAVFGTAVLAGIGAALGGQAGANAMGSMSQLSMMTWQMAAISGYSQELEWEADNEGLDLVVNAGYDASVAPLIFERLKVDADPEEGAAAYYSSHPRLTERQAHYQSVVASNDYSDHPLGQGSADYRSRVEVLAMNVVRHRIDMRDLEEAGKALGRYLERNPGHGEGLFLKAEIARREGTATGELVSLYEAATQTADPWPEAWRELGLALRAEQRYPESARALRRYLAEKPESIEAPLFEKYIEEMSR